MGLHLHVCQGHLREVGQALWDERRDQKFFEETTKVTLIALKLALEPLFFALEFLHNDKLNISSFCGVCFGIATQLRALDLTLIFLQGHSSVNYKQSLEH